MKIPLFAAGSIVVMSLLSLGSAPTEAASNGSQNLVFPQQVEARVPFAPTAFESEGASHLVYELYLTNFTPVPVEIRRIEVLDADMAADQPLAVFEGATLADVLDAVGGQSKTPAQLAPGASVVAYLWLSIKDGAPVPNHLRHRVLTADNSAEGTAIATHNSDLLRLSAPVRGANWLASDGPSNDRDNHHRRGILVINQRAVDSRRYAVDWMLTKNGQTAGTGERSDRNNYYAYAQSVYAVADAVVASAKDGQPENVPALPANFHPAVPITMNTIGGNNIVLSLGHGQYAYYFHLKTGSVQVKAGDHVRRGEAIAQIGVSGDATVPHLHFEVTTSPLIVAGDGVPYEIDHYRVKGADNEWHDRTNGLPLNKMTVDFGPDTPAKK